MDAMIDLFRDIDRMAPGSRETTLRAFTAATKGNDVQAIVEFGCGSGISTLLLAEQSAARVTAVDTCQAFLDRLQTKATAAGVSDRITIVNQSMDKAWPSGTQFDLIWCEGAVYNMGLETALTKWRPLLSNSGRIAVSDLIWLEGYPEEAVRDFWEKEGLFMPTMQEAEALFEACGYRMIDRFVYPNSDWKNYYAPVRERLSDWAAGWHDADEAKSTVRMFEDEMKVYEDFGSQYGYVFFVAEVVN